MKVATRDLEDNRARPQIPCPEVHPFPIAVPNPTRNPDRINNGV